MIYFLYASIGIIAGICSGLFGIGGGIVIVPMLVYFAKFSQARAVATSLVALLLPVGALAVYEYYNAGKIGRADILCGLVVAGGLFIGASFGAQLGLGLSETTLRRAFAVFLMLVSVRLFLTA